MHCSTSSIHPQTINGNMEGVSLYLFHPKPNTLHHFDCSSPLPDKLPRYIWLFAWLAVIKHLSADSSPKQGEEPSACTVMIRNWFGAAKDTNIFIAIYSLLSAAEFLKAATVRTCGRAKMFRNCARFGFLNQKIHNSLHFHLFWVISLLFYGFYARILTQNFPTKLLGAQNNLLLESLVSSYIICEKGSMLPLKRALDEDW